MKEFFGDPYSMQMYGIVFGYLSIARLTVSYQRYWEVRTPTSTYYYLLAELLATVCWLPATGYQILHVPTVYQLLASHYFLLMYCQLRTHYSSPATRSN